MSEYFLARTVELEMEIERRVPFRQKYYWDKCYWDSYKGAPDKSRAERILEVQYSDQLAYVITEPSKPLPPLRYHLWPRCDAWQIRRVDMKCEPRCSGRGCTMRGGTGWVSVGDNDSADSEGDLGRLRH